MADDSTVNPAISKVDAVSSTNSTADLFPEETEQLTDDVMANLTSLELSNVTLFGFDSETDEAALERRSFFGACKTYPGDWLWPSNIVWKVFNLLLGGQNLIKTVPFAAPCYSEFGGVDQAKCDYITANWVNNSYIHIEDPTSINSVLFQGMTCMPPTINPGETTCTVGGYPEYAIDVRNVAQVQLAVNLARNLNLRLVVKNTGHDFGAKSTGKGALSIWTHNLKQIKFYDNYRQDGYFGPAFKLGAGVQAYDVYEAAHRHHVTLVGGEGATVGVMGGYIAGGGHSPLSSLYGMAADQVLSMEVVTASGRFVTASATSHPDLFWALCGGGGSTYGVVTSVVVKAKPKLNKVTIMNWELVTSDTVTADMFWAALKAFFVRFPTYTAAGQYEYFRIQNLGGGAFYSDMGPWFAPNYSEVELRELLAPLMADFATIGVDVNPVYQEFDDFYPAWQAAFPLEPWGSNAIRQASRLFPKENWADETKMHATFEAIKSVVEEGGYIIAFNIGGDGTEEAYPDNAVNPAWRNTYMHCIMATFFDPTSDDSVKKVASDKLTFDWMERFRQVSPGAGAYMSESDYIEPDFTQAFWGTKYAEALRIKKKWDPRGVFYAQNGVGSEEWEMSEMYLGNLPSQNSKLCRK